MSASFILQSVVVILAVVNSNSIFFNVSQFETCTLNLVNFDCCGNSDSNFDLSQSILFANRKHLPATFRLLSSLIKSNALTPIGFQHPESCSINIVVHPTNCYDVIRYSRMFFPREYHLTQLFINVILSRSVSSCSQDIPDFSIPSSAVVVTIILTGINGPNSILRQYILCATCPGLWISTGEITSIPEIFRYWRQLHSEFGGGYVEAFANGVSVSDMSTKRPCAYHPRPYRSDCYGHECVIETMALNLNLSVSYIILIPGQWLFPFENPGRRVVGRAVLDRYSDFTKFYNDAARDVEQINYRLVKARFLYCTNTHEREGFDFRFWATPFEFRSWMALFAVFCLQLLVVRDWLPVFGSLFKQACGTATVQKRLVVFNLVLIIVSCAYESVISSRITVLPPVKIINTFRELIELNYKVLKRGSEFELRSLYNRSGILYRFNSSLEDDSKFFSFTGKVTALAQCNVSHVSSFSSDLIQLSEKLGNNIQCHILKAKDDFINVRHIYAFGLYVKDSMKACASALIEAGITNQMYDYADYLYGLPYFSGQEKKDFNEAYQPFEFSIWDDVVSSIFIPWATALFFSVLIFLLEYMPNILDWGIVWFR